MRKIIDPNAQPDDDLIAQHRAQVEYNLKQQKEEIPGFKCPLKLGEGIGGCASICGEFFHAGHFYYGKRR